MFKKVICIVLVIVLTLSIIPSFAANEALSFKDVAGGYWGKASIDYISSKGYMVGYGDKFGILDPVTEGQYLAVLCRIFGYTNQSPLTVEQPARELGLLQPTDVVNVTANLNRGDIAKYTIRAFERLNPDVAYPDYLEAYHSLVKDYKDLSGELKPIVLKCVEKGLLAGGSDGRFSPNDETTRAQAAAFIHRILEQSERDKVQPIFATPDPEFEAFMNSEEAQRVVNPECYYKVVDGKILFTDYDKWKKEPTFLLPTHSNKDINKKFYEALKTLVHHAKNQNNYVHLRFNSQGTHGIVAWLDYFTSEEKAGYSGHPNFTLNFETEPSKVHTDGKQKLNTDFIWEIISLGNSDHYEWSGRDEIIEKKYQLDEFKVPLRDLFVTIYGKQAGELLYNHAMNEWVLQWNAAYKYEEYSNQDVTYYQNLGLEVQNYTRTYPYFGTNDLD